MTFTLHISELAEADLAEAASWYQHIRPGLAADFALCLEQAFDRILDNPNAFPVAHAGARRALVRRFPYAVLFRVRAERVEIEAVYHGRKAPAAWRKRLG